MAKDTQHASPAPEAASPPAQTSPAFDRSKLEGLTNVAARIPQYDGGDARMLRPGTKAHPIHGLLLGTIDLPSKQLDAAGKPKPWIGIVIELLQVCPVKEGNADNQTRRIAQPGEKMILTESAAFARFSPAADHPTQVVEAFIEPVVGKNAKGQPLWTFPVVALGRPIPRTIKHLVGVADLLPEPEVHQALPEHASA